MKKFVFRKSLLILGGILGLSGCTSVTPTPTPVVVTETNLLYKDDLKDSYKVGDVFDNLIGNGGLQVSVLKSDGSTSDLNKTNFAYSLLFNNATEFDGHTAFTQAGSYKVTISKTDLTDICYYITVKGPEHVHTYSTNWTSNATGHWHAATCEHVQMFTDFGNHVDENGDHICDICKFILEPIPERVVLTEIKASGYTTQVYKGEEYSFDGKVVASYSDGNTKEVTSNCDFEELKTDVIGTFTKNITYSENGIEKTTTYTVKVVEKPSEIILVNSLSLNKENLPIVEGDVYKLLTTILPENATNKTLSWLSSNDSVVAVNDGTITAKAVGTATITAKTTDGSNLFATCNVTVEAKSPEKILVTDLLLDKTSSTLRIGDTLTINSSVEPYNATNKTLSWSSSKSTVASVSNGVVTAKSVGTTTITAKTTDGSNISATCSITVEAIKVSEIQLSLDSTEINVGESKTITAKVLPENAANKSVTWSTNSSSVATVTNAGVVKGIAKGKAVISATAKDGSGVKGTIEVNVNPILVTSISLTPNEVEVGVGSTQQLSASVLPTNATNKEVAWSSSNTSVASISSTGLVTANATGSTTIKATAKDGSAVYGSTTLTVTEFSGDAWTLLIYMCGADLESDKSQGGAATEDLTEIYSLRSSLPDDVNVVIQAGGASRWESTYSSVINKDKCNRFHLTKTGFVKDSQTSKANMGLESTLESFVEWGLTTYPAEKVGLVFWNHGGAMDGCCYDEQYSNDSLEPKEVASAIPTAINKSKYDNKLEFIGYDCCLMSVQDIAGLNAEYANYMIASEESEWGFGWTYDEWVDDLFAKKPTETILKACVDSFYESTNSLYPVYYGETSDQTLAYYNLKNWDAYETAWEDFSKYLSSNIIKSSSNWTTFKNVVNSAKKYGQYTDSEALSYNNGYLYDIFDVKDFLNKFKANSNYKSNSTLMSKVSSIESAFTGLNVYSKCGSAAGNSNGLCMFCPISGYNQEDVQYASGNTCFTEWRTLCINYGSWYSGWYY